MMSNLSLSRVFCVLLLVSLVLSAAVSAEDPVFDPASSVPVYSPEYSLKPFGAYQTSLFSGGASYSYSFDVPPGTNGLAPSLSLEYDSGAARGRAGWVGLGWTLSESYILRDVNFTGDSTSDDKFVLVLNGHSHDLVYESGSRYHTKIESFLYVENRSGSGSNSNGDYWVVRDKSGLEYRFGFNGDSEHISTQRDYVWRWSLDLINDTHDNRIYFNYSEDPSGNDLGAVYLDAIWYNNDEKRVINFVLEDSDRPDMDLEYVSGSLLKFARRLKEINIAVDNTFVRKYVFSYSMSEFNTESLLSSITVYGSDDSSTLPATSFSYQAVENGWVQDDTWKAPTPLHGSWGVRVTDVNGDGYVDLLRGDGTGEGESRQAWINLRNGSWDPYDGTGWASPTHFNSGGEFDGTVLGDVNGDGLVDIFNDEHAWLNNGTGWEQDDIWKAPTDLASEGEKRVVDVNGDGYVDIISGLKNDQSEEFYDSWINLGNGSWLNDETTVKWDPPDEAYFVYWDTNAYYDAGTVVADVNGDGLVDILHRLYGASGYAWLNNGSGWLRNDTYAPPTYLGSHYGRRVADVNGDGFADIISSFSGDGEYYDSWVNNGSGSWVDDGSWDPPSGAYFNSLDGIDQGLVVADVNGDGFPDLLHHNNYGNNHAYLNKNYVSPYPDLLVHVRNMFGGETNITYIPSSRLNNTGGDGIEDLRILLPCVNYTLEDNNLSGIHRISTVTRYLYANGSYDFVDREFRGFGYVKVTDSLDSTVEHWFHQSDSLKGREYRTLVSDSGGNPFSESVSNWSDSESGGVYTVYLDGVSSFSYDGVSEDPRESRVEYGYDSYGNVNLTHYLGEVGVSEDEKTVVNQFVYNSDVWIVDRLNHTVTLDAGSNTVSESWFYYDDHGSLTEAPTKGDLTKGVQWLDSGSDPETVYSYDSYGNRVSVTDPEGKVTSYVYDSSVHTFPVEVTNALSQTYLFSYDLGSGNLLWRADPNGFNTSFVYDVFGRVSKEIRPYDSSDYPTVGYTYSVDGSAPESVLISRREVSGQAGTLDSYSFVDGFGRPVQSRVDAEDISKQVVANTFYDSLGRVSGESVPHLVDSGSTYTDPVLSERNISYSYDVLDRVTQVVNTDGSSRGTSFMHWIINYSDENSNLVRHYMDAFNRIALVSEYLDGVVYNTSYSYDTLDNLVNISDSEGNVFKFSFDSLGRKTELFDPDLGNWTYSYNGVGNLVNQTDARDVTVKFEFDDLHRLVFEEYVGETESCRPYCAFVGTRSEQWRDPCLDEIIRFDNCEDCFAVCRFWGTGSEGWYDSCSGDLIQYADCSESLSGEDVCYTYDSDVVGSLAEVMTSSATFSYGYDERLRGVNETLSADGSTWVREWAYDALDRPTAETLPDDSTIAYSYNNQGLLDSITGVVSDLDYNAFGKVTERDYANGLSTTLSYNSDDFRLNQILTPDVQNLTYTYDDVGNVLSITEMVEEFYQSFTYDGLNRLSTATENAHFDYTFGYNSIGNILWVNESLGSVSTKYTYGDGAGPHALSFVKNESITTCTGVSPPFVGDWLVDDNTFCELSEILLSILGNLNIYSTKQLELNDTTLYVAGDLTLDGDFIIDDNTQIIFVEPDYTYDENGNLQFGFGLYFEYDGGNRLKKVRVGDDSGDVLEEYWYDYDGNRFKKKTRASDTVYNTTYYIGREYETFIETTAGGDSTTNTKYYHANNELLARDDGSVYYYHPDHLGGTHTVTDGATPPAVVERSRYYPFGGVYTGGDSKYLYTGKELDKDTGLYYYGARYYAPGVRRWTQPDVNITDLYNPQDLNRYTYVRNNPLVYVDPSGNVPQVVAAAAATAPVIGAGMAFGAAGGFVNYQLTVPAAQKSPELRNAYIAAGAGAGAVGGFAGAVVGGLCAGPAGVAGGDIIVGTFAGAYTTGLVFKQETMMLGGEEGAVTVNDAVTIGLVSAFLAGANTAGQEALVITSEGVVTPAREVVGPLASGQAGELLIQSLIDVFSKDVSPSHVPVDPDKPSTEEERNGR